MLNAIEAAHAIDCPEREKVERLETELLKHDQLELPPKHYFAPGVYAREITIPAGTALTGKIHKTAHLNILSQGDISVLTEEGMRRLQAPYAFVAPPGTKRAGYTHTDTVWTTVHGTQQTDLELLEDELIAASPEEYEAYVLHLKNKELPCLG